MESGDEWSHRLQNFFSTNEAENMFKACHTVSQSICDRLSFGISHLHSNEPVRPPRSVWATEKNKPVLKDGIKSE